MEFLRQPEIAWNLIKALYSTKAVTQWFREAMDAGKLQEPDLSNITTIYTSLFQGVLFWPQVVERESIPEGKILEEKIDTVVSVVPGACGVKNP